MSPNALPVVLDVPIEARLTSLLGLVVFLVLAWAMSTNRRIVPWRVVLWGVALQLLFGLFVLRTALGQRFFGARPRASTSPDERIMSSRAAPVRTRTGVAPLASRSRSVSKRVVSSGRIAERMREALLRVVREGESSRAHITATVRPSAR